jgi:hypothetical protein
VLPEEVVSKPSVRHSPPSSMDLTSIEVEALEVVETEAQAGNALELHSEHSGTVASD